MIFVVWWLLWVLAGLCVFDARAAGADSSTQGGGGGLVRS
jgi:hypothetical protein